MACQEINERITFENAQLEKSYLKIVNKDHYIRHERFTLGCSQSMEHVNCACQKNEVLFIEFLSDQFGVDTLHLELSTAI